MNHFFMKPNSDIQGVFGEVRDEVELYIFPQRDVGHFDLMIEEGDTTIPVHGPHLAQTEDILGGAIRFGDGEGTKETQAGFAGVVEADGWDFAGSGMDLVVVISIDFVS